MKHHKHCAPTTANLRAENPKRQNHHSFLHFKQQKVLHLDTAQAEANSRWKLSLRWTGEVPGPLSLGGRQVVRAYPHSPTGQYSDFARTSTGMTPPFPAPRPATGHGTDSQISSFNQHPFSFTTSITSERASCCAERSEFYPQDGKTHEAEGVLQSLP